MTTAELLLLALILAGPCQRLLPTACVIISRELAVTSTPVLSHITNRNNLAEPRANNNYDSVILDSDEIESATPIRVCDTPTTMTTTATTTTPTTTPTATTTKRHKHLTEYWGGD